MDRPFVRHVPFGDGSGHQRARPEQSRARARNLYVVDASFFPSSGGINPGLTIAANALRVAAHLNERF